MLTLALALAGQAAALPTDTAEAARICSALEVRAMMAAQPGVEPFARALHLNLLAARETRGNARMLDHLVDVEQPRVMERVTNETDDPALGTDCRRRFPQVWATTATLPADAFDRATLCVAAVVAIEKLAAAVGDTRDSEHWHGLTEHLVALPIMSNAEQQRHGINSAEMAKDNADRMMRESLDSSGLLPIAQRCDAAYPTGGVHQSI